MTNIGFLVQQERKKRNWTIRYLASQAKISPALVCQIERGNIKHPTMVTIEALENALELPLKNLVYKEPINTELTPDQKLTICLTSIGYNMYEISNILSYAHYIEARRNNEPRR